LASDLHNSLFDGLLHLDDGVLIYPGHGAGSLCGRAIGSMRSTTMGYERKSNPALLVQEKDAFVEYMTHELPEQPGNHKRIKALNRLGPKPMGEIEPTPLSVLEAIPYFQKGAALLDTRPKADFVEQHVPGSVHLEADDQLANRIGFILPPDVPIVLLLENEASYREVALSLHRVGYEKILGYLWEGLEGWVAAGLPVSSGDVEDIDSVELQKMLNNGNGLVLVDVREPWEYNQGHIPQALSIPLGDLARRTAELDTSRPVAVICATGNRSQSAAAVLGQRGFTKVYNVQHGMMGWQREGFPVSRNGFSQN
jgi:rhodanese-related sulfurtransferase